MDFLFFTLPLTCFAGSDNARTQQLEMQQAGQTDSEGEQGGQAGNCSASG